MLSTNCQAQESGIVTRKLRVGTSMSVLCTNTWGEWIEMTNFDNTTMSGSGRKYYKYIFWFLLDVSISNSYILFLNYATNDSPRRLKCPKEFLLQLVKELIANYCSRKCPGRGPSVPLRTSP